MKISNSIWRIVVCLLLISGLQVSCDKRTEIVDPGDLVIPENFGTLEVDFELPPYTGIQSGIRRVDLAVCHTMDEMYRGKFFNRVNVSDAKRYYQIYLPEGTYYYQAAITCTCGGDSCLTGGFPYGYGGLQYAFDEVTIEKGKKTVSRPAFQ
jgi:hypothetical protein